MQDASSADLIAERYAVDPSRPLSDAGGGLPAFAATDTLEPGGKLMALSVSRDASPRIGGLQALLEPIDNLLVPLACGVATGPGGQGRGFYVICPAPPGQPVSAALTPWPETALIDLVLRPVARVLEALRTRGLTHRAIRLNNVFQAIPGQPITLGAAWAAPAAMHQPALFESPYQAMCHPAGRGEGSIADDVYSLGVLMLVLATGRLPLANLDESSLIRWKLDLGSFAALTRDAAMSTLITDLIRGMLAEDPEHRPPPSLLLDPANARTRRVAARPVRRSQRPLMLGDIAVFDARTLGYALLKDDKRAIQTLRSGMLTQWLRRGPGDAGLASAIEDIVRSRTVDVNAGARTEALMLMDTISAINPRMPLCWRGIALWPDSIPFMLADGIATRGPSLAVVEELLTHDVMASWASSDERGTRAMMVRASAGPTQHRQYLQAGGPGAMLRLYYVLNPALPCRAAAMATQWVITVADLLLFLDQAATDASAPLVSPELSTFIAAKADRQTELQVNAMMTKGGGNAARLGELALLRDLQVRYYPRPMPNLAAKVVARLQPELESRQNRPRRTALKERLDALARAGYLAPLLGAIEDHAERAADRFGASMAARECAAIDAELAAIDSSDRARLAEAGHLGHALIGALGLIAVIVAAMTVLVG